MPKVTITRIPENVPTVQWEARQTREVEAGGKPARQADQPFMLQVSKRGRAPYI